MILAGIIALGLFLTVYKCRGLSYYTVYLRDSSTILISLHTAPKTVAVAEDLPLQRNEAYSTVVPLKRNEAYEIVQRTAAHTVNSQTSHDYETVQ